jgi:tRNA threonylcarbamoyladenosine biosynthesis protein TsaE
MSGHQGGGAATGADPAHCSRWMSADDAATEAIGAALAQALPEGSPQALCVHLQGDLGAGKTTLVRGFLRALGATGAVRSPTYGLLESHAVPPWSVLHLDLYRLRDPTEVLGLGLRDHDLPRTVWLIEWPERGGAQVPPPDLRIELEAAQPLHRLTLCGVSDLGRLWLGRLGALSAD